jgi:hypothetical protein
MVSVTALALAIASTLLGCGLSVVGTYDGAEVGAAETSPPPRAPPPADDASTRPRSASGSRPAADGVSPSAPFCDRSDPALIACFEFEGALTEGAPGTHVVDATGTIAFVPGVHGSALDAREDTRVHEANSPTWTYAHLTVELRFRPASLPTDGARGGLLDKDGAFGLFVHSDGSVSCTMGAVVSAVFAVVGKWTHVACVNDGTQLVLYADGVPLASSPVSGGPPETDQVVAIGGNSPDGEPFVGALDDLRVLSRALSPAEVAASAARP